MIKLKICSLLLFLNSFILFSSHLDGGFITYEALNSSNQYIITLNLYQGCNSNPLSAYVSIWNDCNSNSISLKLNLNDTSELSMYCPDDINNSECNGGSLAGKNRYIYTGIVTLSTNCNSWHISHTTSGRESDNIINGNFYIISDINTASGIHNSSPIILASHIPYVCLNTSINWDFGVLEKDGDSLVFSLVAPYSSSGIPIIFKTPYSATTPITGLTINSNTGELSFTPTSLGKYSIAVQIKEYNDKGILVGVVTCDFLILVNVCSNSQPYFDNYLSNFNNKGTGSVYDSISNTVSLCEGDKFCFDLIFNDDDGLDTLSILSPIESFLPNSTITLNGVNPTIATVCWSYNPSFNDPYVLFLGQDDNCPFYGHDFFKLNIESSEEIQTKSLKSICGDMDAELNVVGDYPITWSVLNGDPIQIGSNFSCDSCNSPIATPDSTTTYLIKSGGYCKYTDTVTINVINGNLGNIKANILNVDTSICLGDCLDVDSEVSKFISGVHTPQFVDSTDMFINKNSTDLDRMFIPGGISFPLTTVKYKSIKEVCVDIIHSNVQDLDIFLIAPDGNEFELSTGNGGTGDNYLNTCFTIGALDSVTLGSAPFIGNYIPEGGIMDSAFIHPTKRDTVPTFGFWNIRIKNNGNFLGILNRWDISFNDPYSSLADPDSISWSNLDGISLDTLKEDLSICPRNGGEYILTAYDKNNCWASDTINIAVLPGYAGLDSTVEVSVYAGQTDLVNFVRETPDLNGNWSDSITGNQISQFVNPDTLIDLTTFAYIVNGNNGCIDTAYITLDITDYCISNNLQNPNVLPLPNAGLDNLVDIKYSQNSIDLFNYLIGTSNVSGNWIDFGGIPMNPLTTTQYLDIYQKFDFYYIVENANGCTDTSILTINLIDDLGVTGIQNNLFKIYPNPTNGQLYFQNLTKDELTIELYDITGRKIALFDKLNVQNGSIINLSNYSDGMYSLRVLKNNEELFIKKILLQR